MNKPRGVIFDAGDVIYDATIWRKWFYNELQKTVPIKLEYTEFYFMWDNYYLKDIHLGRIEYQRQFRKFLTDMQIQQQDIDDIIQLSLEGKIKLESATKPYKWVYEYMPRMKQANVVITILTDTEQRAQDVKKRYDVWGISEYIDYIVTSKDIGTIKPYPEAYKKALKEMHMQAEYCIFVGHDYDELTGAKNMGIITVDFFDKDQFRKFLKVFDD